MAETGTVKFEKYVGWSGRPTVFYSGDATAIASGSSPTISGFTFKPLTELAVDPGDAVIRAYEVYIDDSSDTSSDIVTRLARISLDPLEPNWVADGDAEVCITNLNAIGVLASVSSLTVKNLTGNPVDVRVILVGEAI